MTARLVRISGVVQGVGYRAWMARTAPGLGVLGWVRNLGDGRVEAVVEGETAAVEAMVAACRQGPAGAEVREVVVESVEEVGATGFAVRR